MLLKCVHRIRLKHLIWTIIVLFILDFFGVFTHLFESDFGAFNYPLEGDVLKWARQLKSGQQSDRAPINQYNYTFVYTSKDKCAPADADDNPIVPKLVILVKSARENFIQRNAIRHSWGFEKRFSDVIIRTVFLLGSASQSSSGGGAGGDDLQKKQQQQRQHSEDEQQKLIEIEIDNFGDIVLGDYLDSYFNNTIKTMMGMRWAIEYCSRSKFYMFVDDDFYVSTKNILRFIRNPVNYPEYIEEADETLRKLTRRLNGMPGNGEINSTNENENELKRYGRSKRHLTNMKLPNHVRLFAGFVFTSSPHRHKSSKWYISLDEYPWHRYPTYVTAGAMIFSREALRDMYYVSMFTKHFRFDDIYLAIVARKANIEPLHSEEIHFHKAPYYGPHSYKYVIASHDYRNSDEMLKVWSECRAAGHA